MMKIIVIGILYKLLFKSTAADDSMVKIQVCNDTFSNAVTKSLNQIEQSELKEDIGDFETERSQGNGVGARRRGKKKAIVIPITSVRLIDPKGTKILSNNMLETRLHTIIYYGEKPSSWNEKKKSYLFLEMEILTVLRFQVNAENIVYYVQSCEVSQRKFESNQIKNSDLDSGKIRRLGSKLCRIVRKLIAIMNENWKDYLIIDPSGDAKLVPKSVLHNNPDCVEINFNVNVKNSEVNSAHTHEQLMGNRISVLKDYIPAVCPPNVHLQDLNRKLEKRNIQLSSDELQKLIHDVFETNPTDVTIIIEDLRMTAESDTMTVMTKLEASSRKSNKSIFQVVFSIDMKVIYRSDHGKLRLRFLSSGNPVISSWETNIGESGDLDYNNLQAFIVEIVNGALEPDLNGLEISCGIPLWNIASKPSVRAKSIQFVS